jgi:hypothetical protein
MIWNVGPTDGRPYLVDFKDIMDASNYRTIADNLSGGVNEVASDYKGLVTTEFTLGIRLNLDNGGSLRAAYINRSWANDYAYVYNGFKPHPSEDGTQVISRLLKNMDNERYYNSVELEWNIPVTKQVDFGGSYTFSRSMATQGSNESNSPQKSANKSFYWWEYYDDQFDFPHWGYKPVILQAGEHRFNAYLNYDLTYGKVKSNAALRFAYNSSGPSNRTYTYEMGFPIVPGLSTSLAGENAQTGISNLGGTRTVYYNVHRTGGPDSWSTTLVYNLEVPVTNKLRWFATVTSSNPFNHRGKGTGWYSLSYVGSGIESVIPKNIYYSDGSLYRAARDPFPGGYRATIYGQYPDYNLFAPNQVQSGRSIGLQTGLRF